MRALVLIISSKLVSAIVIEAGAGDNQGISRGTEGGSLIS